MTRNKKRLKCHHECSKLETNVKLNRIVATNQYTKTSPSGNPVTVITYEHRAGTRNLNQNVDIADVSIPECDNLDKVLPCNSDLMDKRSLILDVPVHKNHQKFKI